MASIVKVSSNRNILGEGLAFFENNIFWTDIESNRVFVTDILNNEETVLHGFHSPSQCLVVNDEVFVVDRKGLTKIHSKKSFIPLKIDFNFLSEYERTNDCEYIGNGNFLISIMSKIETRGMGRIVLFNCFDSSNSVLIKNLSVPNSVVFDEENNRVFLADSTIGTIFTLSNDYLKFDFDATSKLLIFSNSIELGIPDGSTLSIGNNLWNCSWGASKIVIYSPKGKKIDEIHLENIRFPTSCAFNHDNSRLYITSDSRKSPQLLDGFLVELDITL